MSDLISRSEVNDVIDELEVYTCGRPNTMKVEISVLQLQRFINKLKNIPTAYDIDNVIEELEEMIHPKQLYFCKYVRGGCKHLYNNDKDCMECIVENAIEIVKQGAISDDVCKWKIFDNSLTDEPQWVYKTTCGKYIGEEHTSKAFVYCPYCSKKIKVME